MFTKLFLLLTITTAFSLPQKELSPRIFNGETAVKGQFPWQVGIIIPKEDGQDFCGGALISDTWILTAGQCLREAFSGVKVLLGTLKSTEDDPEQIEIYTRNVAWNDQFDPLHYEYDVGLVLLPEPVAFTDYIKPILLATEDVDVGTSVTVMGWGATSEDGDVSSTLTYSNVTVRESCFGTGNICADSDPNSETQNVCGGDRGSPLVLNAFTYPVHIGITSFNNGPCEAGGYGGFTSTVFVREWIKTVTGV